MSKTQAAATSGQNAASAANARALRDAFGRFMTGVTVATATSPQGAPLGFTANSFASVSLQPPLLLVCPARRLGSFAVFNRCSHFAVNVLAESQRNLANRFAAFAGERFDGVEWRACPASGAPLLEGAAAVFSCAAHKRVPAGDHIILIGEVLRFAANDEPTLGYADGGYFARALERRANELAHRARKLQVGAIIERNGRVLLCPAARAGAGDTLPAIWAEQHTGSLAALRAHLAALGLQVKIGAVYSVVENAGGAHSVYYRAQATAGAPRGVGKFVRVAALAARAAPELRAMLSRYCLERQNGNFGLYIGDADAGDVHHTTA